MSLEETIAGLSKREHTHTERTRSSNSENQLQIESIIFDFERKQAALVENHHEQQQVLKEEIYTMNSFLNQKERRIQELENGTNDLKNAFLCFCIFS